MSIFFDSKTCMIFAPNFDQTHEFDILIRLEDLVEDLGFMHRLCIHVSYETSRPLSFTLSDVGHVCKSYDRA